ncbi:MAG: hypothetical protein H6828_07220 [Planctomycetes bacterium]|nr:hypothetical protein [Planctomycetota bacterium]
MSDESQNESFSEAHLNSPEYRERLTRKLNCLIALLEVAMARVRRSLRGPEPDVERLTKIRANLQSTLDVCLRARTAIERHEPLPADLPESLSSVSRPAKPDTLRPRAASLPLGAQHELSSPEETRKFQRMGKISHKELADVDLEELTRKLQGL